MTCGFLGKVLLTGGQMIVTIVGAGRLAEGVAVRALAGGHRLRVVDSEPGKADALTASLAARGARRGAPELTSGFALEHAPDGASD